MDIRQDRSLLHYKLPIGSPTRVHAVLKPLRYDLTFTASVTCTLSTTTSRTKPRPLASNSRQRWYNIKNWKPFPRAAFPTYFLTCKPPPTHHHVPLVQFYITTPPPTVEPLVTHVSPASSAKSTVGYASSSFSTVITSTSMSSSGVTWQLLQSKGLSSSSSSLCASALAGRRTPTVFRKRDRVFANGNRCRGNFLDALSRNVN